MLWCFSHRPWVLNWAQGIIKISHKQSHSILLWYTSRNHHIDVIMDTMLFQITSFTIVYSTVYLGADQRKLRVIGFVRGIHRSSVNSLHKGPVTRKRLPFDDVIMTCDSMPSCAIRRGIEHGMHQDGLENTQGHVSSRKIKFLVCDWYFLIWLLINLLLWWCLVQTDFTISKMLNNTWHHIVDLVN